MKRKNLILLGFDWAINGIEIALLGEILAYISSSIVGIACGIVSACFGGILAAVGVLMTWKVSRDARKQVKQNKSISGERGE